MAETTTDETEITREEAARFLRSVADDLDGTDATIEIPVGNKEIQLSPPDRFDMETTVSERSRRLRKDVEEVTFAFKWNPTRDTAESETESESDTTSGTENGPESNP